MGERRVPFAMLPGSTLLAAEIGWQLSPDSGTYFAQLTLSCTNGSTEAVGDVRFLFADRVSDGVVYAQLWQSSRYAPRPLCNVDGTAYRYVDLDAGKLNAVLRSGGTARYGVASLRPEGVVPFGEDDLELYVRTALAPVPANAIRSHVDDFVAFVRYVSAGRTNYVPVTAGAARAALRTLGVSRQALSVEALNASLAVGVLLEGDLAAACRVSAFSVAGDAVSGVLSVGASDGSGLRAGTPGSSASVTLFGARTLDGAWTRLGPLSVAADGTFSFGGIGAARFFKIRVEARQVVW
jgi:hypothetical protein